MVKNFLNRQLFPLIFGLPIRIFGVLYLTNRMGKIMCRFVGKLSCRLQLLTNMSSLVDKIMRGGVT